MFSGASLIMVGVMAQQLIFSNFLIRQPDTISEKIEVILPDTNWYCRSWMYLYGLFESIKSFDGVYILLLLSLMTRVAT